MKFTFSYNPGDHGWADATIQNEGTSCQIDSISYLSDAFRDLSEAIRILMKTDAAETSCAFEHEPGRTKMRFTRCEDQVKIEIYKFQNELRDETWDKGELEFTTRTLLKRLKSQYMAAADRILQDIGMEEYRKRWGYDFPIEEYDKIKNS